MGATPTKDSARASPDFVSPQLAAAMSHPTRVHAMSILRERTASPRQVSTLSCVAASRQTKGWRRTLHSDDPATRCATISRNAMPG